MNFSCLLAQRAAPWGSGTPVLHPCHPKKCKILNFTLNFEKSSFYYWHGFNYMFHIFCPLFKKMLYLTFSFRLSPSLGGAG